MAENKTRQQIILLHGKDAFTKEKALELGLQAGELVVEHGGAVDNVKLHTLDGTGDTANLATFITESAITKTTDALSTRIEDLESALDEYTSEGAVKAKFEDVVSLITGNTKDIEDIQKAIGIVEEGGDGETIFDKIEDLTEILGESSATTEGTVWGEINALDKSVEDLEGAVKKVEEETIPGAINALKAELKVEATDAAEGKVVTAVTQTDGVVSAEYGSVAAKYVSLTGTNETTLSVQDFYDDYLVTGKNIEDIEDAIEEITGQTASLEATLDGFDENNKVATAVAAAKTTVKGQEESSDNAYIKVVSGTSETDNHLEYTISIENAASAKAFEDFLTEYEEKMAGVSGAVSGYVATEIAKIVADAPDAFDTLQEIAEWIATDNVSGKTAADIISDVEDLKATLTGFNKTDTVQKKTDALSKSIEDLEDFVQNDDFITVAVENTTNNKITVADTVINGKHSVKLNFDEMVINGGEY